jgi:hypothetical protein
VRERASSSPARTRADSTGKTRPALGGIPALQRSAGNRAVAALLAPPAARAVQRAPDDDWSVGSLWNKASSAVDTVEKDASAALDVVNTPFRNTANSIQAGVDGYAGIVDKVEDFEHSVVHGAADKVAGVPVLGGAAQSLAGTIDTATQVVGGFDEGVVSLVGGLARGVADPVDTVKGLGGLAKRLPPSVMLGAGEKAIADMVTGKGLDAAEADVTAGVTQSFNNVWGGITQGADPKNPGAMPKDAGIARQMLNPFYGDVAKGKGAHAVGRAGADIASIVFGGEIADAATAAGDTALGADAATAADATAADTAPATLREPPVGNIDQLSPAAQDVYDAALKAGKSPSAAFQEAQSVDQAGNAAGLGPKPVRVDPSVAPARVAPQMPEGLSPEAQSVYRSAIQGGQSPEAAAELARQLDAMEGGATGAGPNASGSTMQRGAKRII